MEAEQKSRGGDRPATLRDLILALVVLVPIFLAIVIPKIVSPDPGARTCATEHSIDQLTSVVVAYHRDCSRWPSDEHGLDVLYTNRDAVAAWKGPYVREGDLNDSWGWPLRMVIEEKERLIVSAGPDGQFGTKDDIRGKGFAE